MERQGWGGADKVNEVMEDNKGKKSLEGVKSEQRGRGGGGATCRS